MLASTHDLDMLSLGKPPESPDLIDYLTVASDVWEEFALREYLDNYICHGGSQVKIILGKPGSGKTHLLRRLEKGARERGYLVAALDVSSVRLQHIADLYSAISENVDLEILTKRLSLQTLESVGYDPTEVPEGRKFVEWAVAERNREGRFLEREIQEKLGAFFRQRQIETMFCLAFIQLVSDDLGVRSLDSEGRHVIYSWLHGKRLTMGQLLPFFLPRSIDRYNARDMLDSLSRLARELGFKGLVVTIDNMHHLIGRDAETNRWRLSKTALNDVYQSLREFVDSTPTLTSVMFILAARRELLDDDARGIRSYDALWLRVQHEVSVPGKFNRFGQIVDLDRAAETVLREDDLRSLHQKVLEVGGRTTLGHVISSEVLSPYGEIGNFRKVVQSART